MSIYIIDMGSNAMLATCAIEGMVVVDLKFDAAARGGRLYPRGIGAANLRHSLRGPRERVLNVRNCAFSSTSHVNRGHRCRRDCESSQQSSRR